MDRGGEDLGVAGRAGRGRPGAFAARGAADGVRAEGGDVEWWSGGWVGWLVGWPFWEGGKGE